MRRSGVRGLFALLLMTVTLSLSGTVQAQCPPNTDWDTSNCVVAYCTHGPPFSLYGNWYCPQSGGTLWGSCGGNIFLYNATPQGIYDGSNCNVNIPSGCGQVFGFQWGIYCAPQPPPNHCGRVQHEDYSTPGFMPGNWTLSTQAGHDTYQHNTWGTIKRANWCPAGCGQKVDKVGQQDWCIAGEANTNEHPGWDRWHTWWEGTGVKDTIKETVSTVTQWATNLVGQTINWVSGQVVRGVNFVVEIARLIVVKFWGWLIVSFADRDLPEANSAPIDEWYQSAAAREACAIGDPSQVNLYMEPPIFSGWKRYRMGHALNSWSSSIASWGPEDNSLGTSFTHSEGVPVNGSAYSLWSGAEFALMGASLFPVPHQVFFSASDGFQREVFFNGSAFWDPR